MIRKPTNTSPCFMDGKGGKLWVFRHKGWSRRTQGLNLWPPPSLGECANVLPIELSLGVIHITKSLKVQRLYSSLALKMGLHLKEFDPSPPLVEPKLKWIYTCYIHLHPIPYKRLSFYLYIQHTSLLFLNMHLWKQLLVDINLTYMNRLNSWIIIKFWNKI